MDDRFSRRTLLPLLGALLLTGCQGPQNLSVFEVRPMPAHMRDVEWSLLADDASQDGQRSSSADGKSFLFHYDTQTDTLWFRLELHRPLEGDHPALSVAIDTDADQATGIGWYGANSEFRLEKMLSVGPLETVGDSVRGYNGVTDSAGVASGDWINVSSGTVTLYVDDPANAYVFGIAREQISPGLQRFHVIGSVGSGARWNDDIGESGFATVDLTRPDSGIVRD